MISLTRPRPFPISALCSSARHCSSQPLGCPESPPANASLPLYDRSSTYVRRRCDYCALLNSIVPLSPLAASPPLPWPVRSLCAQRALQLSWRATSSNYILPSRSDPRPLSFCFVLTLNPSLSFHQDRIIRRGVLVTTGKAVTSIAFSITLFRIFSYRILRLHTSSSRRRPNNVVIFIQPHLGSSASSPFRATLAPSSHLPSASHCMITTA